MLAAITGSSFCFKSATPYAMFSLCICYIWPLHPKFVRKYTAVHTCHLSVGWVRGNQTICPVLSNIVTLELNSANNLAMRSKGKSTMKHKLKQFSMILNRVHTSSPDPQQSRAINSFCKLLSYNERTKA